MRRLNQLIENVESISLGGGEKGDLFPFLRDFFSNDEVKKKIIEFNQHQLFNLEQDREGNIIGAYSPRIVKRKIREGLPSVNYTFYETGTFFKSMDVYPKEDCVEIITSDNSSLKYDSIGKMSNTKQQSPDHIDWMMSRYNPSRTSLGIQDNFMRTIVEETEMINLMRDDILECLNNG